ncbi:MAG: hypothetical protein KGJ60_10460 [Verrucomicrobiota bacterium]|nr:hypothetical protein [Verrucomicrobiota bacterium]
MSEWLTKDLGWKAFSVILAVAVWVTVHNNQDKSAAAPRRQITYGDLPVMAVSLPADNRAQLAPAVVTVTVSGPNEVMAGLQARQIRPIVNLGGLDSGNNLQRSVEVAVPPGVTFISAEPAEVSVTVSHPAETNEVEQKKQP